MSERLNNQLLMGPILPLKGLTITVAIYIRARNLPVHLHRRVRDKYQTELRTLPT